VKQWESEGKKHLDAWPYNPLVLHPDLSYNFLHFMCPKCKEEWDEFKGDPFPRVLRPRYYRKSETDTTDTIWS